MPVEPQEGIFDFTIKGEHLYALGLGCWSQYIQRNVLPDHYPVVLKIQVFPKYKGQSLKEPSLHQYRITEA
jgi:hypothetical protein